MSTFELSGTAYYRKRLEDGGGQGSGDVEESFRAKDEKQAIKKAEKIIRNLHGSWGRKAGFELQLKEIRVVKKFSIDES